MTRDPNLIRQILFKIEEHPHGIAPAHIDVEGYTAEQVDYHKWLLVKAGLANGMETTSMGGQSQSALISGITPEGHDFIDAARNDTVWKQAMAKAKESGGSISLNLLQQLLQALAKKHLGLDK